jgi:hypothetical protein
MQSLAHPAMARITNFTLQEPKVNTFYKVEKPDRCFEVEKLTR